MNAAFILQELLSVANPEKAVFLQQFFKTGKGQYAEGDVMLGIIVPIVRDIVKKSPALPLNEIRILLDSEYHEARLTGLLFLVKQFKKGKEEERKAIFDFYLQNARRANNWDLVDVTCRDVIGLYLLDKGDRSVLYRLAESDNLWEQRIAIVSTWMFIKHRQFNDTLAIAEKLLPHKHDLIHKAVGWMLREVGKKDRQTLVDFLETHCTRMPRTALRYAIEHFMPEDRARFMSQSPHRTPQAEARKPYKDFADFLQSVFTCKVQKISIDAGFTCPTRDGSKGWGGCTYCNNQTFSPQYAVNGKPVSRQLEEGIRFFSRKYPRMKYLAYFQSYTNTYGSVEKLLALYNEALDHPDVVGLIIGTRPDCVPDELLDELQRISRKHFLLVEYGVESTCNETLQRINRGHSYEDAVDAIRRTHARGIYCGVHLILGLPGETREMILSHADRIAELPVTTVKLHQLQLIRDTLMARQWEAAPDQFRLYEPDEYIELCIDFMERLSPDFFLDRFVSQSPESLLVSPAWGLKNFEFTAKINKRIKERNSHQGKKLRTKS